MFLMSACTLPSQLVMHKSGSVRFSKKLSERRTGPHVRFSHFAERENLGYVQTKNNDYTVITTAM